MRNALYFCLFLLLLLAWHDWSMRDIVHPPGVLVAAAPRQESVQRARQVVIDEFRLTPRARFDVEARVLSREDYWLGDEADLSPVDLALGWGPMSNQAVLDRIRITQSGRWYFTRYESPAPLPDRQIINSSSNMHIIPANDWVRKKLKKLRRGHIVQLKGALVDVDGDQGFVWRTSLRRDDTGNGSCEIFYVEEIFVR